jgi:uncharacterized membrane protein YkvA (DUF1232 family)
VRFVANLPSFVKLFLGLLADRRVGFFAKALLVGGVVYAVTPLDFLPDYLPFIGQMDDLAILVMALRMFMQLCPPQVVDEHVARIDPTGKWAPYAQG